ETLYFDKEYREVEKIGNLSPVVVSAPQDVEKMIANFVRLAQDWFAKSRTGVKFGLSDLQGRPSGVKKIILYEVAQGEKSVREVPQGAFSSLSELSRAKVYALLPLLPGYDCDLAHLAYSKQHWVLQNSDGQELSAGIACVAKQRQEWIV